MSTLLTVWKPWLRWDLRDLNLRSRKSVPRIWSKTLAIKHQYTVHGIFESIQCTCFVAKWTSRISPCFSLLSWTCAPWESLRQLSFPLCWYQHILLWYLVYSGQPSRFYSIPWPGHPEFLQYRLRASLICNLSLQSSLHLSFVAMPNQQHPDFWSYRIVLWGHYVVDSSSFTFFQMIATQSFSLQPNIKDKCIVVLVSLWLKDYCNDSVVEGDYLFFTEPLWQGKLPFLLCSVIEIGLTLVSPVLHHCSDTNQNRIMQWLRL